MSLDDLSNKIEQKLDCLLKSLDNLKIQQKSLEENSEKLKNFIHSSTDKEQNSLKQRERQLIRQVEVVASRQRSVLDSHIAKLLHIKGSLTATQEILHQCQREDFEALTNLFERLVTRLTPVENLQLMSVQFDSHPLEAAIASFGKVQLPDMSMKEDPRSSPIFPSSMEEYGDSDHDVLHKSIGMCSNVLESDDEGSTIVKIQFPKIPDSEWLAKSSDKNSSKSLVGGKLTLNSDVPNWLADCHRSSPSLEDKKSDSSSFEFIECDGGAEPMLIDHLKIEKTRCLSTGSSIEIVSQLSSEKDCCSYPGNNNLDDFKNCWLSLGRSTSTLRRDSPGGSICDLKESNQEVPLTIDMEELACQANEPCRSYDECVCDGYCKEIAKERALQTSKWLLKSVTENKDDQRFLPEETVGHQTTGIKRKLSLSEGGREVLKHMKYIWNSDKHQWLSSHSQSCCVEDKVQGVRDAILYKPRSHSWLSDAAACEGIDLPSFARYSPHSNIWLLHKMKEVRKSVQDQKNKTQQDTENSPHNTLLVSDLKGALAELSVILPKFSPNSSANSVSSTNFYSPHNIYNAPANSKFSPHSKTQVNDRNMEYAQKLRWLSQSEAKFQGTSISNFTKNNPNSLPDSLVELAEKDLNKWLMDRL